MLKLPTRLRRMGRPAHLARSAVRPDVVLVALGVALAQQQLEVTPAGEVHVDVVVVPGRVVLAGVVELEVQQLALAVAVDPHAQRAALAHVQGRGEDPADFRPGSASRGGRVLRGERRARGPDLHLFGGRGQAVRDARGGRPRAEVFGLGEIRHEHALRRIVGLAGIERLDAQLRRLSRVAVLDGPAAVPSASEVTLCAR